MRKIIGSLLVVTSIACLTGCGAKNKGENFEFELYSNSSAGYEWRYDFTKNGIVEVKEDYKSDCDSKVKGCGGKKVFKIIPKKAGKTKMNLKYCRFSGDDCREDVTYEFTVSDDLKITEKHSETYYKSETENFFFELSDNPSTGYNWKYDFTNNDIIDIKTTYKSDCPPDVDGCGGERVFEIIPKNTGITQMNLKYCRSSVDDCIENATYEFTVSDDLKITEKHSGSYYEKD